MKKENKTKTYGAKGEKYLDSWFKEVIGVGVNQAIRYMMDDVKNMKYGNVYDAHILVNNIGLKLLTHKLEEIQNRREDLKNELTLLDSSEKELKDAIEYIVRENEVYQDNEKKDRNNKLNNVCNKILIAYVKDKENFDSPDIMSIVDESEVEESMNIVVGYFQNTLKSLKIEDTICLHENEFDDGYKIKLERDDVDKLLDMLDDLRF